VERFTSTHRANWARWGWLAATLSLGIALVTGSWVNYRGMVAAVHTLNRGQADLFEYTLREVTHPGGIDVDAAKLAAFVKEHESAGLRFVGIVDSDGRVVLSGGQPIAPLEVRPDDPSVMSHPLIAVGTRLRAIFPRPPLPSALDSAAKRAGKEGSGPPGRRPFLQVLEFEPNAPGLVARAERILGLATIGAIVLTLAAVMFWRTSQRYETARLRLEEQRRLTVLGEMSAVLAHEIRNPLASLKGHAQLLVEHLPKESAAVRRAERVVDEAKRLEILTADLLDFARSGPMDLSATDPSAMLRSAAERFPSVRIAVDTTRAPEQWPLDERRFGHGVLENLLRNAVQASPASRPPEARVFVDNGTLVFTVRDFGPGLPKGEEERIFDPFFTTRAQGTGLGLPLARRIVELHGGRIVASNAADSGAVFRIELPRRGV
jgi:two-component system sensor histidine kinase HydH